MRRSPVIVLAFALAAFATEPEKEAPGAKVAGGLPRYHRDAEALEQATLAVSKAILRNDAVTARRELDRMAELSPPIGPDQKEAVGSDLWNADGSLQITLTNSREYATAGNEGELFNEFVWVQRTCLHCHGLTRDSAKR